MPSSLLATQRIADVMVGARWQRCRVHLMPHPAGAGPRPNAEMVAAAVRTLIAQPDVARWPNSSSG